MHLRPPDPIALLIALASLGEFACSDVHPTASAGEMALARFTLTEDSAIALEEALLDVRGRLLPTFETLDARQSIELRDLLDEITVAVDTRDRATLRAVLRRTDAFIGMLARTEKSGG